MKRLTLLFAIIPLISCGTSRAVTHTDALSKFLRRVPAASLAQAPKSEFYDVDSAALAREVGSGGQIEIANFPGSYTEFVTLDLKPAHSPVDASTQFWIGSGNGARRIIPPRFEAFRGKVLGEPDSRVFLTTFDGKLLVSITRESGESYVFGPAKTSEAPGSHVFIRQSDLFSYGEFHPMNCIAGDIPQPNAPTTVPELLKEYQALGDTAHSKLLQVDIAVEADSAFYHAAGGDTALVLGYIESLFAASSTIYENEVNITWHLTWVKLWPTGDPYNVNGNAYGLEDTVPNYWRLHYSDVPRDCAHVLTSIGYGGGGYGYLSMCDPNWSYSMSSPQTGHQYPTFAFTYDAYIVAHEIGHNFGLVHTHQCYWDPPIDTCYTKDDTIWGLRLGDACDSLPVIPHTNPGSIMSYCANANYAIHHDSIQYYTLRLTFTPKVDSVLRMDAENSACLQAPPDSASIILLSPGGGVTLPGDTAISILWTYAHVDSISLEYSSDGGSIWNPIASNLNAMAGHAAWRVPNINSQQMLVRAFDPSTPRIADTSLTFFTVARSSLVQGTSNFGAADFMLSPNPARDVLTLEGRTPGERLKYSIVNAAGVIVASGETSLNGASQANFPLGLLPSGTYYLEILSPSIRNLSFTHLQ